MRHAPSVPRSTRTGARLSDKQCSSAFLEAVRGDTNAGSYRTDTEESLATSTIGCVAQADKQKNTNAVVIRVADVDNDALGIMDGARDFASRVAFKSLLPPDREFIDAVGRIIAMEGIEILVAEYKGEIVGGIGILYAPYTWNPKLTVADELFWWCHEKAPPRTGWSLIDRAMANIDERGAIPMFSALETSPPGVRKIYHRFGMKPIETKFARF